MAPITFTTAPSRPAEEVAYRLLLWVAPLAAVVAAVVNTIIFALADMAGLFPDDQMLGPIVFRSVAGVVGAAVVYALLGRFARRPTRLFILVAAVVLPLSFALPFSIAGAGAGYIAMLNLLHVTTAAISVGLLTRMARTA